mmetsp:Transcript_68291/g.222144  ORF Transcript_68291/g.222144 Transcript_68291/m.222144 type:complete len:210 (+) Transcript_68291:559-1188(+)
MVDALAGWAAEEAEVSPNDTLAVLLSRSTLRKVQMGLVAILIATAMQRPARRPKQVAPKLSLDVLHMARPRELNIVSDRFWCLLCSGWEPEGPGAKLWLKDCFPSVAERCIIASFFQHRPHRVEDAGAVRIESQKVHRSPRLVVLKGWFVCELCVKFGSVRPRDLVSSCAKSLSTSAVATLSRVRRGLLPGGVLEWSPETARRGGILLA